MGNKSAHIIIIIVIGFLTAVVIYSSYTPNSEKQETIALSTETSTVTNSTDETAPSTTSTDETAPSTTETETVSTPNMTTITDTVVTTTEDTSKNLPTLKLIVYEGPVIVPESDICYYRIEAIATGDPYPAIKFSKDDSNGAWGNNKAQVNLKNSESYVLVVTATNPDGTTTKHIELSWSQ